jgi:hypothetical protein
LANKANDAVDGADWIPPIGVPLDAVTGYINMCEYMWAQFINFVPPVLFLHAEKNGIIGAGKTLIIDDREPQVRVAGEEIAQ